MEDNLQENDKPQMLNFKIYCALGLTSTENRAVFTLTILFEMVMRDNMRKKKKRFG
jgi:hypothetical protein